jgi:predicted transcriptional regulator
MKAEYTESDFTRGIRNPYFYKLNRKAEVAIRHEAYDVFEEIAKQNGVTPETIMQHCLMDYASELGKAAIDVINESAQTSTITADEKSMTKLLSLIAKMGIDVVNYVAKD